MRFIFKHIIKLIFVLIVIVIAGIGIFLWQRYPFSVKQYKTITLGMQAAHGAGTHVTWAPPDDIVPKSLFYVYAINDESMCIGSSCGAGGVFIECLKGYLAGERIITEEFDYGLRDAGVNMEKQKIITISDKDAKIVGIYPGARIRNLPYIMRNHRDLVDEDVFKSCSDLLTSRWK